MMRIKDIQTVLYMISEQLESCIIYNMTKMGKNYKEKNYYKQTLFSSAFQLKILFMLCIAILLQICYSKFKSTDMQRHQNLKKTKRGGVASQCLICRIARVPFLTTVSSVILLQKYYRPLQKSTLSAITAPLIRPKVCKIRVNFRQAQLMSQQRECLLGYNTFSAIIGKIKPVILECLRRDRLHPLHLRETSHPIMHRLAMLRRKILPPPRPILAKSQNSESTDEDQNSQRPKMAVNPRANQTASMRRLTRNLSSMVRRFEDQNDFHLSMIFEVMNQASKHEVEGGKSHQEMWKRELQENSISEIYSKRHHGSQRLVTSPDQPIRIQIQESYGFQPKQKNLNGQSKPQRKKVVSPQFSKAMKENIPMRIQTDYDCEVIKKSKKSVSRKKDLDKGRKFLGSSSRKKDKLSSVGKSRVN